MLFSVHMMKEEMVEQELVGNLELVTLENIG